VGWWGLVVSRDFYVMGKFRESYSVFYGVFFMENMGAIYYFFSIGSKLIDFS
jgi:hypothetical protein